MGVDFSFTYLLFIASLSSWAKFYLNNAVITIEKNTKTQNHYSNSLGMQMLAEIHSALKRYSYNWTQWNETNKIDT